jgi:hypothetical protein
MQVTRNMEAPGFYLTQDPRMPLQMLGVHGYGHVLRKSIKCIYLVARFAGCHSDIERSI